MTLRTGACLILLATLPMLAACQSKSPADGKAAEAAEVLPGSASDAMIAYDTLKSQPPIAAPEAPTVPGDDVRRKASRSTKPGSDAEETAGNADVPTGPSTAPERPAAEPSQAP